MDTPVKRSCRMRKKLKREKFEVSLSILKCLKWTRVAKWAKVIDNKEFSKGLELRTRQFAVEINWLSTEFPNIPEGRVIRNQITKSGASIGVNYRKTNRLRSKADLKNRIKICESEVSKTQYWIEVIIDTKWLSREDVDADYEESSELLALITSIGSKP